MLKERRGEGENERAGSETLDRGNVGLHAKLCKLPQLLLVEELARLLWRISSHAITRRETREGSD